MTLNVLNLKLILLNLSTYLLLAFDKYQFRNASRWRIPESVLLCLAFLGGGIGGYVAIRHLRHKSLKRRFVWVYRIGIVVTIYLLCKFREFEDVWGVFGWDNPSLPLPQIRTVKKKKTPILEKLTPLHHLCFLNSYTFALFAFDKFQSQSRNASGRRIRESALLYMAFLGGGVGGYAAIRILGHKSLKGRFVWTYRIGVLVTVFLMIKLWEVEDVWGVFAWGFCGIQAGIAWTVMRTFIKKCVNPSSYPLQRIHCYLRYLKDFCRFMW
ncbi:hypothetical protein DFS34DRAFT_616758 [Phlyctochytrium arcticum]|nr:hypothetical protein DFS34DRAFT_616758 [Phlyctochytrium arcticum]